MERRVKKCAKFVVDNLINDIAVSIWIIAKLSAYAQNHT